MAALDVPVPDKLTCEQLPLVCPASGCHVPGSDPVTMTESYLIERLQSGDKNVLFLLGQFYFDQDVYSSAMHYYKMASVLGDYQAIYQLGIMLFDGINCTSNTKAGMDCMLRIIDGTSRNAKRLHRLAQYNIGKAYYEGCKAVAKSEDEAERYWLAASVSGETKPSNKAQCALGLLYSSPRHFDLKKALFWHRTAAENGNLESLGIIGYMYLDGIGVQPDYQMACTFLKAAVAKGNVFAMGQLVSIYYRDLMYNSAIELASTTIQLLNDVDLISRKTDCMALFIRKGISMAYFYLAECLARGRGVAANINEATKHYMLSFDMDNDTCFRLRSRANYTEL